MFRRGQGVFGIAVGPVQAELEGEIHRLFPGRRTMPSSLTSRPWRRDLTVDFRDPADAVEFAHDSERQFARLLDFYGIAWEYEPTLLRHRVRRHGTAVGWFTPDFYLPEEALFIEITTMNQKLVTKKNRKVRLLARAPS